jgi:hypothetical protein
LLELEGEQVIDKSADLRRIVGSAAQIHEWDAKQNEGGDLNLNLLGGRALIQVNSYKEPSNAGPPAADE